MQNNKILQGLLCSIIATFFALTSHIYFAKLLTPFQESIYPNTTQTDPNYPIIILVAAYVTAFIMVSLKVFLYCHTQNLLRISSHIVKILLVTCIFLELNGTLIRGPIMDYLVNYTNGMKNPSLLTILSYLDRWIASLLLATSIVFLCPQKINNK